MSTSLPHDTGRKSKRQDAHLFTSRRILQAVVSVGALTLIVKLVAMIKESTVASLFGRSDAVDAFLVAFLLPSFLVTLVAKSLSGALIPTYIRVRNQEGPEAAQRLLSSTMLWSQGMLLCMLLVLGSAGPLAIRWIAPGFAGPKLELTVRLFYMLLPLILLGGVSSNCGAILNANGRFWPSALFPVMTPVLTLLFLVTRAHGWGIKTLVAGTLAGSVCETVLLLHQLRRIGIRLRARWYGVTSAVRTVRSQYSALIVRALLTSGVTVIDQSMAAWLQPGSVSALAYGKRLVVGIVGLTSAALTAAMVPYFSEMVAAKRWEACQQALRKYARLVAIVMIPLTVAIMVLSRPIIFLLYQRGGFTAHDTQVVANVQAMYALQIPFNVMAILYMRLLTAMDRNDLVMAVAGINLALDVVLNLICMKYFGIAGIALSTSLFYVGSLFLVVYMARKLLRGAIRVENGIREEEHELT